MHSNLRELSIASIASRRAQSRRRVLSHAAATHVATRHAAAGEAAIDEAFAASDVAPLSQRSLVRDLSDQLAALDRQREQLAHLLRSIDADALCRAPDRIR